LSTADINPLAGDGALQRTRISRYMPHVARVAAMSMLVAGLASCADDRVVAPGDAGAPSLARGFPPWIRMESDVETGLEAVWGTSPNTLFAVGVSGTIQHFDGERWVRQESGV